MIFLGRASLERAITEHVAHYHGERSHQGMGNQLLTGVPPKRKGAVETSERLGALLKYYHGQAA